MNSKKIFGLISYLSLPFYLWGVYFLIKFIQVEMDGNNGWEELNNTLVLIGIGLTLASLKDANRGSNAISKRIWEKHTISVMLVSIISLSIGVLIMFGLSIMFFSQTYRSEAIAVGMIVLGIGMIGYLKYAVERIDSLKQS